MGRVHISINPTSIFYVFFNCAFSKLICPKVRNRTLASHTVLSIHESWLCNAMNCLWFWQLARLFLVHPNDGINCTRLNWILGTEMRSTDTDSGVLFTASAVQAWQPYRNISAIGISTWHEPSHPSF
jgi:hypothetical protein